MIRPALRDRELLQDIAAAAALPGLHLWWLGQSGFLVQCQGRHLLLDPYLSDSLTAKYANSDRPHVRMTERTLAPEALGFVDLVTSSHNHTDHLDAETLGPILAARPGLPLVIPEANRAFVRERLGDGAELLGLNAGQTLEVAGFTLRGVASAHEALERDDGGRCRYLGYLVHRGPWTIYHSGDTVRYPGLAERLRPFQPDLALLPINGRAPERQVSGNLDGPEAAELARDIAARLVIPCHYEMFTFNTASPEAFVARAEALGQGYRVLRAGERWSSGEPGPGGGGEAPDGSR